jgi:hypothetical protein
VAKSANRAAGHGRVADSKVEAKKIFGTTYCRLLAFEIEFKNDEIRASELWEALGLSAPPTARIRTVCGSRSESTDYHLHVSWTPKENCIAATIEFAKNYRKPAPNEREPYAEDMIPWLRQFIVRSEMPLDFYSDFDFPVDSGRRIMFLPVTTKLGAFNEVDAEIDGVSLRLVPPRGGIEKIWSTQGEDGLTIHLHGCKTVVFTDLDPAREIVDIAKTVDQIFEVSEGKRKGGT